MSEIEPERNRTAEYLKKIPFLGEWLEPTDKVAVLRFAGIIADTPMTGG